MALPKLNRRTFIRGAGGVAIALPWLEAMGEPTAARAIGGEARRFLGVYTPGGTVLDRWRPTGDERNYTMSPILAPLAPVRDKLIVLDGLEMRSARGEQHQAGIIAWLTGTEQSSEHRNFAAGPSVDQVIASRISRGVRPRASLEFAVRWATGNSNGLLHPINVVNFEDNPTFNPIPPRLDPQDIFDDLFGALEPSAATMARIERKRSILDYVDGRYASLAQRLGARDRAKLDQHLTKIRELEGSLERLVTTCEAPMRIDTSEYDPLTGGDRRATMTDAQIPTVGRFMMDMMVMAFACDITAVGTFQWTDTEAKHTFPWLGLSEHHHFYQHDGGFRPDECERIYTWYSEQHAYLLSEMDAVDMGGHSLLDESVVFFGSELQNPPSHRKDDMPFLLAGCGGGLNTGRWARYSGESHSDLLVTILNLFGDERTTFGDPQHCDGPLTGLV
ncbi:MAG: DUF1552 domain-containing protein [Myxococcota bacterium]